MKISAVQVTPLYTPYRAAVSSSWNARPGVLSLLVEVRTDGGLVGYGDGLCKQSLRAGREILEWAARVLVGRDPLDIEATAIALKGMGSWAFKHELSFVTGPLLAAVEMALWDLLGKAANQPLVTILGGRVHDALDLTVQIPTQPVAALEREADAAKRLGFRFFYMKLGKANRSIDEDVDSIRRLREIVGDDATVSADVTGAWSVPTALRALRRLERYDLAFVETPVIGLENMAALRKRVGVPIAADEEACSLGRVLDVIRLGAADVLLLDLASLGGVGALRRAAALAETANLPAVVHSNGELLATLAAFHVAASSPAFKFFGHQFYHELAESYVDELDATTVCPSFALPGGPGLGATVSAARVASLHARYRETGRDVDYIPSGNRVPSFPKY